MFGFTASNTLNPNTVFELLHNTINGLFLPTQGFGELTAPNIVNILLCSSQISVELIGNANVGALVMALNCSCTLRASGNKHSKTALVKVRTLDGLQVKHCV